MSEARVATTPDDTLEPAGGPRRLGTLLSDAGTVALERISEYAVLVACGVVPAVLLLGLGAFLTGILDRDSLQAAVDAGRYADVGLMACLGLLGAAARGLALMALALSIAARLEGEAIGAGEAFHRAIGYIAAIIGAELRVFAWVFGGLLLLIVPGIVLAVRYSQTHWAVLLEGKTGSEALARSKEIMLAHMGKVIGNLIACGACVLALTVAASFITMFLLGIVFGVPQGQPLGQAVVAGLAANLIQGIIGVWGVAFSILLYKDLAALHPQAALESHSVEAQAS